MAVSSMLPAVALAQDAYPSHAVTLVVPYPPGGATDVIGRVVAQHLSGALGQQVVVDNRAGAAGSIGAAMVSRARPDGYTLLLGALTSHSINAALYGSTVQYDLDKGFAPVAVVGSVPLVFVVNPEVPARTLPELIALAKARPGSLTFGSAGNGSPQHLAGEMFKHTAGVELLHVPYKGSGPAMTDLIGGQVLTMIETVPAAQPHIASGKLRALAVTSARRAPSLPEVPTAAEAGLKDFEVSSMFGVLAPAGTPPPIVDRLAGEVRRMLEQPEVRDALLKQGVVAGYQGPDDAATAIRAEVAKWTKVIRDAKIKTE
ncbi:MAG: tripartite tricarboxylate transporter substrate binding protein [Burkholderiaceae bacterium]